MKNALITGIFLMFGTFGFLNPSAESNADLFSPHRLVADVKASEAFKEAQAQVAAQHRDITLEISAPDDSNGWVSMQLKTAEGFVIAEQTSYAFFTNEITPTQSGSLQNFHSDVSEFVQTAFEAPSAVEIYEL